MGIEQVENVSSVGYWGVCALTHMTVYTFIVHLDISVNHWERDDILEAYWKETWATKEKDSFSILRQRWHNSFLVYRSG